MSNTPSRSDSRCFKGIFLRRTIQKRVLSFLKAVCMRLELTSEPNYHIDSVAELIEQDIGLTYKCSSLLIRPFPSAFRNQSINKDCATRASRDRKSALWLRPHHSLTESDELIKLSFIRARFMELAQMSSIRQNLPVPFWRVFYRSSMQWITN